MKGISRMEVVRCPIKLPKIDRDKAKIKLVEDRLTFQRMMEVLFYAYLKNDKRIMEIIEPYGSDKYDKVRRKELTEMEAVEILRMLETENPMNSIQDAPEGKMK